MDYKIHETYFSFEDGKPTLWDTPGPNRLQAACIEYDDGFVDITTQPDEVPIILLDK